MLGSSIKKLREKTGLSARAFGLKCGLKGANVARSVYRWEADSNEPSEWCMYNLWLLGLKDAPEIPPASALAILLGPVLLIENRRR